jgi:hypothetical protein
MDVLPDPVGPTIRLMLPRLNMISESMCSRKVPRPALTVGAGVNVLLVSVPDEDPLPHEKDELAKPRSSWCPVAA